MKRGPVTKCRGLLVSYSGYPDMLNYFMPDNGLANLAGALLAAGHAVRILDYETPELVTRSCCGAAERARCRLQTCLETHDGDRTRVLDALLTLERAVGRQQEVVQRDIADEIVKIVRTEGIHFVGLKLWEGLGYKGSVRIAERIRRKCPGVRLFAGGPHADIYGRALVEQTAVFDAIALGDGEEIIAALAECAIGRRRLSDIPNILFRDGVALRATPRRWIADLDTLPMPCYAEGVYPAMRGHRKIRVLTLDDSRGCPNQCHFCIHPLKSGSRRRWKSQRRIRAEIGRFRNRYGCSCFRFAGSSSLLLARRAEGAAAGVETHPGTLFTGFLHAGDLHRIDLRRAHEQGCYAVFIGLESANEQLLREVYGKKTTCDEIGEAIVGAKQAGIYTVVSVIFPGPHETDMTRRDTLRFLTDTRPDSVLVLPPRVLPGTEWYRHPGVYGFAYGAEDVPARLMEFERPHFVPAAHGEPLCFTVDGRDHRTQMRRAAALAVELKRHGITVGVSDEAALLAHLAGYQGREAEFTSMVTRAFLTGQAAPLADLVRTINDAVLAAASDDGTGVDRASGPVGPAATSPGRDAATSVLPVLC